MSGRPRAKPTLTPDQIQGMAAIGCTDNEIAVLASVSERTLQNHFCTQLKEGRAHLRHDLRKAQVDRAKAGSDTMLIWLGKQYLDQRDKNEISGDPNRPLVFEHQAAVASLAARPATDREPLGADEGRSDGA